MANKKKVTVDQLQTFSDGMTAANDARFAKASDTYTKAEIDAKNASVYKVKGSQAFAALTADLLVAANQGNVYNVTDAFTTTADFVEGAGKKHPAGSNVAVVEATAADNSDPENPVEATYKFDVLAGDFSGYALAEDAEAASDTDIQAIIDGLYQESAGD